MRAKDPRGRNVYWVGQAGAGQDAGPGTDFHAVANGYASITPLQIDLTRHAALPELQNGGSNLSSFMEGPRLSGIGMTSARTRERLVQRLQEQGIADLRVLDRIRNVPRHLFVDEALATRAYEDTALPIGFGQTISQPYVVARMTEALLAAGPAPQGARDRHRVRLSNRGAVAAGEGDLHHRAHCESGRARAPLAARAARSATCIFDTMTATSVGRRARRSTEYC